MSLTEQKSKEKETWHGRVSRLGKLWGIRLGVGWTAFMGLLILGNLQSVLDGAEELREGSDDGSVVSDGSAMVILMGTVACMGATLVFLHLCSSLMGTVGKWADERTVITTRLLGRYASILPMELIFYLMYKGGVIGWSTTKEVMLLVLLIPIAAEVGQRVRAWWSKRKDNQAIGPDSRHLVR